MIRKVRCPRSRPRRSMSAPIASETRRPFNGEETQQRMVAPIAQPGSDEHRTDLVTVQTHGMRLVVQTRASDVRRRRGRDETFLFGVAVEARDRAQPSSD